MVCKKKKKNLIFILFSLRELYKEPPSLLSLSLSLTLSHTHRILSHNSNRKHIDTSFSYIESFEIIPNKSLPYNFTQAEHDALPKFPYCRHHGIRPPFPHQHDHRLTYCSPPNFSITTRQAGPLYHQDPPWRTNDRLIVPAPLRPIRISFVWAAESLPGWEIRFWVCDEASFDAIWPNGNGSYGGPYYYYHCHHYRSLAQGKESHSCRPQRRQERIFFGQQQQQQQKEQRRNPASPHLHQWSFPPFHYRRKSTVLTPTKSSRPRASQSCHRRDQQWYRRSRW